MMMPERYNLKELKRAIQQPSLFIRESRKFLDKLANPYINYQFKKKYPKGVEVINLDWDNHILLDACRYDYFSVQNSIEGDLQQVVSQGGNSYQFLNYNFSGKELHDTIYITTNPYADKLPENTFYLERQLLNDKWDDKIGTVHPSDVNDVAKNIHKKHSDKRLIIHYMQPHTPYLGSKAEEIRERINLVGQSTGGRHTHSGKHTFAAFFHGDISLNELRQGYKETLDIVLKYAKSLVSDLNGKSVISADHGELLGERLHPLGARRLGHPGGLYTEQDRMVPWHIIPSSNRREIKSKRPVESEKVDRDVRNERLRALGYK